MDAAARAVFVVEDLAASGRFPGVPVIYDVLPEPPPGSAVTVLEFAGFATVEVLGRERGVGQEGRFPGHDRIDGAAIRIGMSKLVRTVYSIEDQRQGFVLVVDR